MPHPLPHFEGWRNVAIKIEYQRTGNVSTNLDMNKVYEFFRRDGGKRPTNENYT